MLESLQSHYLLLKALHIISFTAWMAGMFYLPRLFAYHAGVVVKSEASELFKVMERRLLRIIINPAMIATFVFGILLYLTPGVIVEGASYWFHAKLTLLLAMATLHGYFARCRKAFAADKNTRSPKFYRILNEVPTVLFVVIVLLAILKPFGAMGD